MAESEYHNYSFCVDLGLHVCSRAPSEEVARARIERSWPRSKIELIGVDLPSADRSRTQEFQRTVKEPVGQRPVPSTRIETPKKNAVSELADKLGITETEASLVQAMQ